MLQSGGWGGGWFLGGMTSASKPTPPQQISFLGGRGDNRSVAQNMNNEVRAKAEKWLLIACCRVTGQPIFAVYFHLEHRKMYE